MVARRALFFTALVSIFLWAGTLQAEEEVKPIYPERFLQQRRDVMLAHYQTFLEQWGKHRIQRVVHIFRDYSEQLSKHSLDLNSKRSSLEQKWRQWNEDWRSINQFLRQVGQKELVLRNKVKNLLNSPYLNTNIQETQSLLQKKRQQTDQLEKIREEVKRKLDDLDHTKRFAEQYNKFTTEIKQLRDAFKKRRSERLQQIEKLQRKIKQIRDISKQRAVHFRNQFDSLNNEGRRLANLAKQEIQRLQNDVNNAGSYKKSWAQERASALSHIEAFKQRQQALRGWKTSILNHRAKLQNLKAQIYQTGSVRARNHLVRRYNQSVQNIRSLIRSYNHQQSTLSIQYQTFIQNLKSRQQFYQQKILEIHTTAKRRKIQINNYRNQIKQIEQTHKRLLNSWSRSKNRWEADLKKMAKYHNILVKKDKLEYNNFKKEFHQRKQNLVALKSTENWLGIHKLTKVGALLKYYQTQMVRHQKHLSAIKARLGVLKHQREQYLTTTKRAIKVQLDTLEQKKQTLLHKGKILLKNKELLHKEDTEIKQRQQKDKNTSSEARKKMENALKTWVKIMRRYLQLELRLADTLAFTGKEPYALQRIYDSEIMSPLRSLLDEVKPLFKKSQKDVMFFRPAQGIIAYIHKHQKSLAFSPGSLWLRNQRITTPLDLKYKWKILKSHKMPDFLDVWYVFARSEGRFQPYRASKQQVKTFLEPALLIDFMFLFLRTATSERWPLLVQQVQHPSSTTEKNSIMLEVLHPRLSNQGLKLYMDVKGIIYPFYELLPVGNELDSLLNEGHLKTHPRSFHGQKIRKLLHELKSLWPRTRVPRQKELLLLGLALTVEAEQQPKAFETLLFHADAAKNLLLTTLDGAVGILPYADSFVAAYQLLTGKNLLSQTPISGLDYILASATILDKSLKFIDKKNENWSRFLAHARRNLNPTFLKAAAMAQKTLPYLSLGASALGIYQTWKSTLDRINEWKQHLRLPQNPTLGLQLMKKLSHIYNGTGEQLRFSEISSPALTNRLAKSSPTTLQAKVRTILEEGSIVSIQQSQKRLLVHHKGETLSLSWSSNGLLLDPITTR